MVVCLGAPVALAQVPPRPNDTSAGSTFINPFPENDVHRVQVYGEGFAEGMLAGVLEAMAKEPRLIINRKHRTLANLLKGEITEELRGIEPELDREPPHVAIIMPSMIFRFPWRENFDRRFPPGSEARREEIERRREAWKADRATRFDQLMRAFKRRNIAVYLIGLPIMRNNFTTDDAQVVNELIRERAIVNGGKYIDIYSAFADEGGAFNAYGPDIEGKPKVLRDQDGVHLTPPGYRKLGHFVERELKRDLAQARTERVIPLAGNEDEQRRVRPATTIPAPTKASAQPG